MSENRRLAAIMFTDVVGYSALMEVDEEATICLLDTSRQIQKSLVQKHQGKWVKEMGDGVICVFGSTVSAVQCAIEIQLTIREEKDLNLKIAIHSGEILEKNSDVFGDGVNVTFRIEQLSQSNVILLSERANADIHNVKSIETTRVGTFELKNIEKPMTLYAVTCKGMSIPNLTKTSSSIDLDYSPGELMSDDEKFLQEVQGLIQRELTNPQLSIPFISDQLGVSRSKLYRRMLAISGQAPGQLISEFRLQKAAKLLEKKTGNISQVAYECGFNNLSYFSKAFQERFGKTPSEYMKTSKQESNLPATMHEIIGREKELTDLQIIIQKSRLTTISGTGGTGKTRLAVELLRRHGHELAPNTCFVQLAPVTESNQVMAKIAQSLQIKQSPGRDIIDSVQDFLESREVVMVLDNFEHVLDVAYEISLLLSRCPDLRIIVTSRNILNVKGEVEYVLNQLPVPDKKVNYAVDGLLKLPSIALFVDRTREVKPDFVLDEENKDSVCAICSQLDGLPLAIELAAARMKLFSPQALLNRLTNRLDILSTSSADLPERHRTLRNAINWSYSLLTPDEQTLFRRLSIFAGGCTLEAAEQICFEGYSDNIEILDRITSLLDKSLLQKTEQPDGEPRFSMLETIKEFGLERLNRSLEMEDLRCRYIEYYQQKFNEARGQLTGPEQGKWLDRLELELDNLRAILMHCETLQLTTSGYEVALSFHRYWTTRSMMVEGVQWMKRMIAIDNADRRTSLYCDLLNAYAQMYGITHSLLEAKPVFSQSLEIARKIGYHKGLGTVLNHLGWVYTFAYDYEKSSNYNRESLQINTELGDDRAISVSYSNQGWIERMKGDLDRAGEMLHLAGKHRKKIGDFRGYGWTLSNNAWVAIYKGDYVKAREELDKALTIFSDLDDNQLFAWGSTVRCYLLYYTGDLEKAIEVAEKCHPLWCQVGVTAGQLHLELIPYMVRLELDDLDFDLSDCHDLLQRSRAISDLNSGILIPFCIALAEHKTGEFFMAQSVLKEVLELLLSKKAYLYLPRYLELAALNFYKIGNREAGVQLFSFATRLRDEWKIPIQPVYEKRIRHTHSMLQESLSTKDFTHIWLQGQKMNVNSCLDHFGE